MQSLFQLTIAIPRRTRLTPAQRRELKGYLDLTICVVKWIAGTAMRHARCHRSDASNFNLVPPALDASTLLARRWS
jgi:hypothetical protein